MKITRAKFGYDEKLFPTLYVDCKIKVPEEESGKFQVGFGIVKDKEGQMTLVAFRETPNKENIIAILEESSFAWLKAVLEKSQYKWFHNYYSDIEEVDGFQAFAAPFSAEGVNDISEIREQFQQILKILQEGEKFEV